MNTPMKVTENTQVKSFNDVYVSIWIVKQELKTKA